MRIAEVAILFEASPGFQRPDKGRQETSNLCINVAILFEASPGFQPGRRLEYRAASILRVAILFEASPGFQHKIHLKDNKLVATESQSSLKRVLVSNCQGINPHGFRKKAGET